LPSWFFAKSMQDNIEASCFNTDKGKAISETSPKVSPTGKEKATSEISSKVSPAGKENATSEISSMVSPASFEKHMDSEFQYFHVFYALIN
ncbi:MAG: hypothetical protein Q8811_02755, partial [Candidatus Phytoplasma australasiaticum]|nr:hypothetical protein [Candidatus Phytoplasma australasiaticum]